MAYTQADLENALQTLGVRPGSTLFVHSSFKSLGYIEGGAATVIAALEASVGEQGTLLMPNFNMASRRLVERAALWDRQSTPSSVGYLTEYFRCLPGTLRSNHYSHSVAARGALADWITNGHEAQEGYFSPWDRLPWGRTYGTHSPMVRALEAGVQVLLLGVDYHCLTYTHLAEVNDYNRRLRDDPTATYQFVDRRKVGDWWESEGTVAIGKVGDADCRLFNARDFVERATAKLRINPEAFEP